MTKIEINPKKLVRKLRIKDSSCRRDLPTYGHFTNNYVEVAVRLFKDIVLCRSKAFNLIALVEYVVTRMEIYYQSRLVEFANGRIRNQHLMLERALIKCEGICPEKILRNDETHFEVPSATTPDVFYSVDVENGLCTCMDGIYGRFCKHMAAIYKKFKLLLPNLPACSTKDRYEIARLAYGAKVLPYSFYNSLQPDYVAVNRVKFVKISKLCHNIDFTLGKIECDRK